MGTLATKKTAAQKHTTVGELVMDKPVVKFRHQETLDHIVREMICKHAGACGVIDGAGRFVGFITERDILRRIFGLLNNNVDAFLYNHGTTDQTYKAWDVMIPDPDCLTDDMRIDDAYRKIAKYGYRFMPVVSKKDPSSLCGIVSERDLYNHFYKQTSEILETKDSLLSYLMHHENYGLGTSI